MVKICKFLFYFSAFSEPPSLTIHTYFLISSNLPTLWVFSHVQLDFDYYFKTTQYYTKWQLKVQMQLILFRCSCWSTLISIITKTFPKPPKQRINMYFLFLTKLPDFRKPPWDCHFLVCAFCLPQIDISRLSVKCFGDLCKVCFSLQSVVARVGGGKSWDNDSIPRNSTEPDTLETVH